MKQFQYAAIKERQKPFKPSEIHFLGLGVTRFNPPLLRTCDKIVADEFEQISLLAAAVEYDRDTYTGEKKEKKVREPKQKKQTLAEDIPYFKPYWKEPEPLNYCYLCGTSLASKGSICRYCQNQFPIKKP